MWYTMKYICKVVAALMKKVTCEKGFLLQWDVTHLKLIVFWAGDFNTGSTPLCKGGVLWGCLVLTAKSRYHHMQDLVSGQTNWLNVKDNTNVELSGYTVESLLGELEGELALA